MTSNRILTSALAVALFAVVGCLSPENGSSAAVTVKSPDGRNEIRLYEAPLRVEALRDGVTLVAPTRIGLKVDGRCLAQSNRHVSLVDRSGTGRVSSPVYKKGSVDLSRGEMFVDFGDWGVGLVARNDGVAYRFETKFSGRVRVDCERLELALPAEAKCWFNRTESYGCEECVAETCAAEALAKLPNKKGARPKMFYLPFAYETAGKTVAVTESDVCDYPVLNLVAATNGAAPVLTGDFARWPKTTERVGGWGDAKKLSSGGRWVRVTSTEDYLVETSGTRAFPWRAFVFADRPSELPTADLVWAIARPQLTGNDFSWVKPGKVAWDWWSAFDNIGDPEGCTTKTYERFIDFAAKSGVEYVIFDEGWSESLNIWKFHPNVDVPHLIDYAEKKGVGIILWMAWAQIVGQEEKVASHFAKLGAKGFKVDFMDRGDAACERFLWDFAEACRRNRMVIDYHGAHHPTGMSRTYPNILNYEGIHGLEQMKFYHGQDIVGNDVRESYLRLAAGPMDYTPGAMDNYAVGRYPEGKPIPGSKRKDMYVRPGSIGTRARQMAMMALFEAPLQMLCDSPTNYEKNEECFGFMAKTPVVWDDTVALGGTPDTYIALARKAKDGSWYVAALSDTQTRVVEFDTSFLGEGTWKVESFRDGVQSEKNPREYLHERFSVRAGEKQSVYLAPGGGFVMRFSK